jgi:hypothetical protein
MTRSSKIPVSLWAAVLAAGVVISASAVAQQPDSYSTIEAAAEYEALALAPADAFFVGYTADLPKLLSNPSLSALTAELDDLDPLRRALGETFGGSAMIALSGMPALPPTWRISLVARTTVPSEALPGLLRDRLVPAWNTSPLSQLIGQLQSFQEGEVVRLSLAGPLPFSMTLEADEHLIVGSTAPNGVETLRLHPVEGSGFADGAEYVRLTAGLPCRPENLCYLDLRTLMPLIAQKMLKEFGEYHRVSQLHQLENVAFLTASSVPPPPQEGDAPSPDDDAGTAEITGGPPQTCVIRLALGVTEIEEGLWRLLASHPTDTELARFYPAGTSLFVQGSMERATDLVDDLLALARSVDPEIVAEYRQELADFRREVGFDPHAEFLSNFAGAWSFGGVVETDGLHDPLFAFRLAKPALFKTHLHTLRAVYGLEIHTKNDQGVVIQTALRKPDPFSYAVVRDVLLVSREPLTIARACEAMRDRETLSSAGRFETARRRVAAKTSKLVYADAGEIAHSLLRADPEGHSPALVALAKSGNALTLSVVPYERMIAVDLTAGGETVPQAVSALAAFVGESAKQARLKAKRSQSMANIKSLLCAALSYAEQHKHCWPESLEALAESGLLADPQTAARCMSDPYGGGGGVYYLYRSPGDGRSIQQPAAEVVMSEPAVHDGGACFGFADGHVEWITQPRADELLAIMRQGR